VHRPDPVRPADVVLRDARLAADRLCVTAGDRPFRVRAHGSKGETAWAGSQAVDGRQVAELPLTTDLFGDQVLLPAGRYELELVSPQGRSLSGALDLFSDGLPQELVGERLAVRLRDGGSEVRLVVAAPLSAADRSAFGQQRLRTAVYAGPPVGPRPGTWLLETFRGRSVGDSPGAVGRELLARNRDEQLGLDIGYVVDDPSVAVPEGARAVVRRTREWYDAMGHAAVYVANAGAPYWFEKRPGQLHLQTWHGTPLKRIGEDRGPGDFSTWRHRRRIAAQAAGWDAMVSPSPYCTEIYRSAFGFEGPVLDIGLPRNDVLVAPDAPLLREQVRARLGIEPGQRVVLYAPTWRQYVGVLDAKPLYLDAERLLRDVPDAVVLLRGHYNSTRQDDVFAGHPRIRDVTRYPDVADLFLAADALVTDYSSVMFDFVLTDRPVVLLVPDLDQYRDVERGFYFDIEAGGPGPLVRSTEEVAAALLAPDAYAARRASFRERFCPFDDGGASRRVVDHLLERSR
jgi:CDP-glycerol glycerophosphotransferase